MESVKLGGTDDLVERDRELGVVAATVERSLAGDGAAVVMQSAAGLGKTRLLEAACDLTLTTGRPVWSASGSPLEAGFALGVALQLFEPVVHALAPAERSAAFSGAAALAEGLFEDPTAGAERGLYATVHGLYWLAVRLATSVGGSLIAVDDAHWCDPASLRLLSYLARRLEGVPLALVVAGREHADDQAASLLLELRSHSGARAIRLDPLSADGVAALVRRRLGEHTASEFCAACAHVTGGNPFLLLELLIQLEVDGPAPSAEEAARIEQLAPQAVLRAVVARLGRLPQASVEVARAIAVLGSGAPLRRCAMLAELDVRTAERVADALVGAGILAGANPPAFEHWLIQAAVEREIPGAARARLHLEAARILHEEGVDAERLGPHLLAGASGGEEWVIDALLAAARRSLSLGQPGQAVRLLRRALDEPPPSGRGPEVLAELARAQAADADPDAVVTIERALEAVGTSTERLGLCRLLGDTLLARGEHKAAIVVYDRALTELSGDEPAARELRAGRTVARAFEPGGVPEALEHAEQVIAAPGESPGERALLANVAVMKTLSGAPREEVRPLVTRAWGDGALLRDEGPGGHLWSLVTAALTWNDWHAKAAAIAGQVLDEARRQGAVLAVATASYVLGGFDYRRGRIEDAFTELERALDARNDGWGAYAGAAWSLLALCLLERGEPERAEAALQDPDDPRWAHTLERPLVLEARGAVELASGRTEAALETYLALGELAERQFMAANPVVLPWHSGAALAAVRLGDVGRARELIDSGLALAERVGAPSGIARLRWIEGLLLGGEEGLDAMRTAVRLLERNEPTLEYLRAMVELGAALRRANRRAEARQPLERARELATIGGATALAARAADELGATGARPRRIMLSGVESLTASERRVAELAAAGRANREIAEELFVTVKAVEFHLGNAYRKLDVRGRRELAGALPGKD